MNYLIDTNKAAEMLAISPNTLKKLRTTGGGPAYRKIGRSVRYTTDDIVEYSNRRKFGSTSEYE